MEEKIENIATQLVDSAIKVHTALGLGLLESAYEICLTHELNKRGLSVECQKSLPIVFDSIRIDAGYRIDMLIENLIIVENKVVDIILPIHQAQLMTYLKLSQCQLGFLLNWNVKYLKSGIQRVILTHKNS